MFMHYLSSSHWLWMMFASIVVIYCIVAAIMFITEIFRSRFQADESPESILRRRYAAGEIDNEECERRLAKLRDTLKAA
jgi:uncharacterized membrane protein